MAELSETYRNQIDRLAERSAGMSEAVLNTSATNLLWNSPPGWQPSDDPEAPSGNPVTDLEAIHTAFERDEPNQDFVDAISEAGKGSAGDMIVATLQVDSLAAQERAFRLRHLPRVRSSVHAACRMSSHGQDGGIYKRGHRKYLDSIRKLGSKDFG
jgi:hypothetical protein